MGAQSNNSDLKLRTARTLKWNTVDRLVSQVLYSVVGIVLANTVSKSDFGIMGVILVFQAFATIFVDSGFATSLLQKKNPTEKDYSTVFWFNLIAAVVIYWGLWFTAPTIAKWFHHTEALISMSRVSFLSFIFTGLGIVQTNMLMKKMDVKRVAVANMVAQSISGGVSICMALYGWGAWALVWQGVCNTFLKTAWLWIFGTWCPKIIFSASSLRDIARVGSSMFASSFLSTVCNNVYSFIIGIFFPLASLGIYTQADKWSKMGASSLSNIFTSTFVPLFSAVQDDIPKFRHVLGKANRMVAFIAFPFIGGLIVMGAPIFHLLFGNKWDAAIPLFQILCGRGIFTVLTILYSNYVLALGYARKLLIVEIIKDSLMIGAIFVTLPLGTLEAMVWGLFISGFLSWGVMYYVAGKITGYAYGKFITDMLPYAVITIAIMLVIHFYAIIIISPALQLLLMTVTGLAIYYIVLKLSGSVAMRDAMNYIMHRK